LKFRVFLSKNNGGAKFAPPQFSFFIEGKHRIRISIGDY